MTKMLEQYKVEYLEDNKIKTQIIWSKSQEGARRKAYRAAERKIRIITIRKCK